MSAQSIPTETKLITGEELLEMGDIELCELIDGVIVPMSPLQGEHGYLESTFSSQLDQFVRPRRLGWTLSGEVGIYIRRNPDRIRAADVAFVSRERGRTRPKGFLQLAPELIVEIVSPTDRWSDIREKIQDYFSIGVEHVVIVEPEQRDVLVYRSPTEFTQLREHDTFIGEGVLQGFALPIHDLFSDT